MGVIALAVAADRLRTPAECDRLGRAAPIGRRVMRSSSIIVPPSGPLHFCCDHATIAVRNKGPSRLAGPRMRPKALESPMAMMSLSDLPAPAKLWCGFCLGGD